MEITLENVEKLDVAKMSIDDLMIAADFCTTHAIFDCRLNRNKSNSIASDYTRGNYFMSLGTFYQNAAIIKQNKELLDLGGK